MTIPELIEILKAAEAGKVIEYRSGDVWSVIEPTAVVIARLILWGRNLRVRTEPREWWIAVYANDAIGATHPTRDAAMRCGSKEPIRVREVLP